MQLLDPLTVHDIALAARHILDMRAVDEHDLKSGGFEDFVERDPIDARSFHGHGLDAVCQEVVARLKEITR